MTVKLNVRVVACAGAVKIGDAVVAPFRPTVGPDVCVHEYDTIVAPLVVAKLEAPSKETVNPSVTV